MTPRIACLVPSITELVFALGLGHRLVARTGFCIHPAAAVRAVPKVGGTKDLDVERLRALAPTHAIVNVDENRREQVDALRGFVPEILVTHPGAPEDTLALIDQLAAAFAAEPGVLARADALRAELGDELARTRPEGRPAVPVLYLIWREPWMTVARDTYIARMLGRVNWQTLPAIVGGAHGAARYPAVHGDEAWLREVRIVLLSSEPYRFEPRDLEAARALCPDAGVRFVDGELLSWYGPRSAAGLAYLRVLAAEG